MTVTVIGDDLIVIAIRLLEKDAEELGPLAAALGEVAAEAGARVAQLHLNGRAQPHHKGVLHGTRPR